MRGAGKPLQTRKSERISRPPVRYEVDEYVDTAGTVSSITLTMPVRSSNLKQWKKHWWVIAQRSARSSDCWVCLSHAEWDLGPCGATKWKTIYWKWVGLQVQVWKWWEGGTIQSCQGLHLEARNRLRRDLLTSCEASINQSATSISASEWSTAPPNGCVIAFLKALWRRTSTCSNQTAIFSKERSILFASSQITFTAWNNRQGTGTKSSRSSWLLSVCTKLSWPMHLRSSLQLSYCCCSISGWPHHCHKVRRENAASQRSASVMV